MRIGDTHADQGAEVATQGDQSFARSGADRRGEELDINVSRIAEEAIADAVRTEKNRRWKEENREAMEAWNAWTREHGLPLEKHRLF